MDAHLVRGYFNGNWSLRNIPTSEQNHVPRPITRVLCVLWSAERPPGACMEKGRAGNDLVAEADKKHFLFLSLFPPPLEFP